MKDNVYKDFVKSKCKNYIDFLKKEIILNKSAYRIESEKVLS